ncbi:PLP-dependent aminotransferase family protein [Cereibacter sphaeroides]|uniref:aminotransferase-like domain-containing protein n=1 Tax=Cereibacter sphaeroides TaxID=1063 RepID=UPI001F187FF5|nr:PLP-dependent aminotransferase family protein [Cereibacter sphaeroides]MCE6961960.1 PLP-dependent aminotransferase family protein [Cereibacter sphaeroides]MCE6970735.1 PLP-dependent aminotransferase family protein [Cereibacter sphaeroides]MCE6975669.1 PLP-dependent aminotransferase family protein [Cereibacter sphaeroides]
MTDTIWHPDLTQFPGPKYLGLTRALREAIREGALTPGEQLPTVRDLAWRLGVTPGTVSRAYQMATQEGLLAATVGRGTFVAAAEPRLGPTQALFVERDPQEDDGVLDLRSPQLPDVGQTALFAEAMRRVAGRIGPDWRDYPTQREESALRHAVRQWLADRVLGPIAPEDIALTHGGQSAIGLVMLCCLRGDRPVVLTEELAYPGFRHAARLARAEVVGVELDQHGLRPDALESCCRRHGPQVLCVTTEAQNPTAARMPEARRAEIVAIARRYELQIIEDDCYTVAESTLPAMRALAPERTWYVGSLSKTVSAALRFGYILCPTGRGEAGRLTAQHAFFALGRPVSDLCLELFGSGEAAEVRRRVQAAFADRLQTIVNGLGAHDLVWQAGLPFVWLRLPSGWRASTFARMAEAEGVLLRSADEYALVHGRSPNAVRLAIAGHAARSRLEAAVDRLSRLLASPPSELPV